MVRSIICAKTGACTVASLSSARLGSVGYSSAEAPGQREFGTGAADREIGLSRRLDADGLVGKLAHDLVELLGRCGRCARAYRPARAAIRGSQPRDPSRRTRACPPSRACAPRAARSRGSAWCCASRRSTGSVRALSGAPPFRSRASCCFSFVESLRSSRNRSSLLAPTKAVEPDAKARVLVLSSEGLKPNAVGAGGGPPVPHRADLITSDLVSDPLLHGSRALR